ncbi:MAG: hydroxymethylglutaryl-CoA synthase family protein, partial [Chloroflexi bacterium]|nr:hydroxymethylglutaryl-CoA synthase family protein [Chloroflexota bacterium]
MAGIRAFGAYVPKYRITKDTKGWGQSGEKAVANFDEDSVTMGVAAGIEALRGIDRRDIDGLIFATTTSPYGEKQGAATIAEALDLRHDIFTTDVTNVLRAGTSALRNALDAVAAKTERNVLVIAADIRMAAPKSDTERNLGDGAAAMLVSDTNLVATIEGQHSTSEHMLDTWRSSNDSFVHTGEDRFIADEGYLRVMTAAAKGLLQKANLKPGDVKKAALGSNNPRIHAELTRKLGLEPAQVQDPLHGQVGGTGAAHALMLLAGALEEAKPGERILVAAYGDGADALLFQTSAGVTQQPAGKRSLKTHLADKDSLPDYDALLQWRQLLARQPARRP